MFTRVGLPAVGELISFAGPRLRLCGYPPRNGAVNGQCGSNSWRSEAAITSGLATVRPETFDLEVCGVQVRAGETILFMLGAANRDPCQFKGPDRLNLKRLNNPHLAFGAGAHFCIGNQRARLEGQIAILRMVQQSPRMRLATQRLEWAPNFGFRSLKARPVIV